MTTPERIQRAMKNAKSLQEEADAIKKVLSDFADEVDADRDPDTPAKEAS